MITAFVVEHPWLSPTALALLVIFGPFVGRWLTFRPRLAWWLTGISLVPVALLTLVAVDSERSMCCEVAWALPTVGRAELVANVVLFVAPMLLAGVAVRRPVLALIAGSGLSAAIELLQALVPELGRFCSTNDWLSNTIGAGMGSALAWVALRLARRSSPQTA